MTLGLAASIVAFGALVGLLSATFGVGGGIVMVPFLVLALGTTQQVAEGTSLLVIIPSATAGVLAHRRSGLVSFKNAAWLGAGGAAGSLIGASVALGVTGDLLARSFGILVVIVGVRLIVQGARAEKRLRRPHDRV